MDLYIVSNVASSNAGFCVLIISNEIKQTGYRSDKYRSNIYSILASIIILHIYIIFAGKTYH